MKQKIVIEVRNCDKCRTKAMKIAAVAEGVSSVALEGADKNQVVVIGEEVDSVSLTNRLRKKAGYACLVSVEEVKPPPEKPADEGKKKPEPVEEKCNCIPSYYPCQPYRYPVCEMVCYDPKPSWWDWFGY